MQVAATQEHHMATMAHKWAVNGGGVMLVLQATTIKAVAQAVQKHLQVSKNICF
jgi:hypothetical protein